MSVNAQFRLGISMSIEQNDCKYIISAKDIFDHVPHYIGSFNIDKSIESHSNQLLVQFNSLSIQENISLCNVNSSINSNLNATTIEMNSIHFDRENLESNYIPFMTGTTSLSCQSIQLFKEEARNASSSPSSISTFTHSSSPLSSSSDKDSNLTISNNSILYHFKQLTTALIVAIPSIFSIADLMQFLITEDVIESDSAIEHVRIIRDIHPDKRFMALIRFRSPHLAIKFRNHYNGKLFIQGRSEQCHVLWLNSFELKFNGIKLVIPEEISRQTKLQKNLQNQTESQENSKDNKMQKLEIKDEKMLKFINENDFNDNKLNGNINDNQNENDNLVLLELPICPLCLERIDECTSGIATSGTINCVNNEIPCPCTCTKWTLSKGDGDCRVCQIIMTSSFDNSLHSHLYPENHCFDCETRGDIWCCLVCGNLGCGRYLFGHAKEHYLKTRHSFSIDLKSQGIWDYRNEKFVHRLIQNKQHGSDKMMVMMEIPPIPDLEKKKLSKAFFDDLQLESNENCHQCINNSTIISHNFQINDNEKLESTNTFSNNQLKNTKDLHENRIKQLEDQVKDLTISKDEMTLIHHQEILKIKTFIKQLQDENKKLNLELESEKFINKQLFKVNDETKKEFNEKEEIIKSQEDQIRDLMTHLTLGTRLENSCSNIKDGKLLLKKRGKKKL